jgi:hypothetical protein
MGAVAGRFDIGCGSGLAARGVFVLPRALASGERGALIQVSRIRA